MSEDWKKEIAELLTPIKTEIAEIKKLYRPSSDKIPETTTDGHKNLDEIFDCPNCQKELYPKFRKKVIEELKDADHQCVECGFPVKGEVSEPEEWECESCGGREAEEKS